MSDNPVPLEGSVPVNTLEEFVAGKRAQGLTRRTLGERFGASRDDADTVQRWAVAQGLSVSRVDLDRRQMHLIGSAAMSKAFGVKLSLCKHARTGTHFRCPEDNIRIPESLVPIIAGVFGLNDMPVVVRNGLRLAKRAAAAVDPQQQFPGSFYPNQGAKLYNFPPAQGARRRGAVLEFGGGFDPAVLSDYFTKSIGLPAAPTVNAFLVLNTDEHLRRRHRRSLPRYLSHRRHGAQSDHRCLFRALSSPDGEIISRRRMGAEPAIASGAALRTGWLSLSVEGYGLPDAGVEYRLDVTHTGAAA